jgi:hypothetical protein
MAEGLQFYQNMQIGTVAALVMNEDGTPRLESHPDVRKGKSCYTTYQVGRKVNLCVVRVQGPRPLDPQEYRAVTKEEARDIDRNTEYSMYGVFAAVSGKRLVGRFFEEIGEEGKDWYEVPHRHLRPSLVFHGDIASILADLDVFHVGCAARAFGIEVIDTAITMQRTYGLHRIIESSSLYEAAPKVGPNLLSVIWKADLQGETGYCSGCCQVFGKDEQGRCV